ncbi:protein GRAVITROPIC IN THE LIGHT 1 isoform X2 [Prosopis cineraria]|uniref:protein GRAVITROPIC IN THE LIGHT 1 isoform X2 n=1 Tax=Prosopis cineraria TaxID=364024 RepID=UPI00240EC317|nr:protein GRAVITROPIC IN THE LIGHT 1 isoform X2 [Prosopis cineraria]
MTRKVSNFSDLIQRVTASCLLHPLADTRYDSSGDKDENLLYESEPNKDVDEDGEADKDSEDEEEDEIDDCDEGKMASLKALGEKKKLKQMESLLEEVFEAVSAMKRSYVSLQEAHCPWDPEKMRVADVAVVAQLRKLGVLRERFRRRRGVDENGRRREVRRRATGSLREVVAPYEAVVNDLIKEVKAKDLEVHSLKEKLDNVVTLSSNGGGKKVGRSQSKRKLGISQIQVAATPSPELFETAMLQVRESSKSFTSLLLSLMHNAHWDITAAVRSIEAATASATEESYNPSAITIATSIVSAHHAKYALESYISRKFFQGFDHETFYMDGSLSSLLNPDQFKRDCFTQYHDMKSMDPTELLGILPSCHFGKFCSQKYLAIVHPKMEESLFGNLEQHQQVSTGSHPRSQFYNEFLGVAKAVWLLHLLAFSLNPAPSQFEASRGAEFHSQYMESVVRFSGGRVPAGQIVGFPVSPGFKLGNGSVVKARVYLIARA